MNMQYMHNMSNMEKKYAKEYANKYANKYT